MKRAFNELLIFMIFYQQAKNQAISSFYSRDIVDFKILQSDWLIVFWPISQETDFSEIWNFCREKTNAQIFQ